MRPVQLKMARAALGLSVDQLAAKAGLSHADVGRMEDGSDGDGMAEARVREVFDAAGILWIGEDGVRFTGAPDDRTIPLDELNSANDE